MPLQPRQGATQELTRGTFVLSAGGAPAGWKVWIALLVVALLAAAATTHYHLGRRNASVQQQSSALLQVQQLQSELEQSLLRLRVSAARSQELERQIDALNRSLRESQEELTFFRRARDGKR